MVGWPPPAARRPPRCSLIPPLQQPRRRKYHGKPHGQDKGKDISYQLLSQAKQTQLKLGKFNLLPSNIKLDGKKQRKKTEISSSHPRFFPGSNSLLHSWFLSIFLPSGAGNRTWGSWALQDSSVLLHHPQAFPCSCVSSCVFPLLGLQSFRITLLQHQSSKRMQFPSEPSPDMDIPASTGGSVDICSTMAFSMGCRGIHQGCRAISSSVPGAPPLLLFLSPLLSAELFVSLVFLIPHTAVWHFALSYTLFPRSGTTLAVGQPCPVVGWLELSGTVGVWHRATLAPPHMGHP